MVQKVSIKWKYCVSKKSLYFVFWISVKINFIFSIANVVDRQSIHIRCPLVPLIAKNCDDINMFSSSGFARIQHFSIFNFISRFFGASISILFYRAFFEAKVPFFHSRRNGKKPCFFHDEMYIFFDYFFVCVSKNSLHLCLEIYFVIFQFVVSLFFLVFRQKIEWKTWIMQKIESKNIFISLQTKFTTLGRYLLTLLLLIIRRLWMGITIESLRLCIIHTFNGKYRNQETDSNNEKSVAKIILIKL